MSFPINKLSFFVPVVFLAVLGSCKNYGTKTSREYLEIFYNDGITDAQADKTLNFLYPLWRLDGAKTGKKSVQLTKNADTVNFRMVTLADQVSGITEENIGSFIKLMSDSLYDKAPVNLVLCDPQFNAVKTIRFKPGFSSDPIDHAAVSEYGIKHVSGNVEVFAKGGIDPALVDKLAKFMDDIDEVDTPVKSYSAEPDGAGYRIQMVVDRDAAEAKNADIFVQTASLLSDEVFGSKRVQLVLCNALFQPFREVSSNDYKP